MVIKIPETEYPALKEIVDREYTDGLDRILLAQENDDGTIVCIGQDGNKQLKIEITDTRIKFGLIGAQSQFSEQPDPIDPIITQLKPIGDATFAEWFVTLQELMQESENLVEFRDKLTDAYPDLDASEFKQAMLDASTVAGMKGYSDARVDDEFEFAMSDLEVEFKIPEGTTKEKNGKTYVLKGSRWRLADKAEKKPKSKSKTKYQKRAGCLIAPSL